MYINEHVSLGEGYVYPASPADQTKCRVFRMVHASRIPDPTEGSQAGSKYWFPGFGFDSGPNLQRGSLIQGQILGKIGEP